MYSSEADALDLLFTSDDQIGLLLAEVLPLFSPLPPPHPTLLVIIKLLFVVFGFLLKMWHFVFLTKRAWL